MDRLAILLGVFLLCGLATAGWWGDVDSDGDGLTDEVDDDDDNDGLLDTGEYLILYQSPVATVSSFFFI